MLKIKKEDIINITQYKLTVWNIKKSEHKSVKEYLWNTPTNTRLHTLFKSRVFAKENHSRDIKHVSKTHKKVYYLTTMEIN